jgi:hypothetical protein
MKRENILLQNQKYCSMIYTLILCFICVQVFTLYVEKWQSMRDSNNHQINDHSLKAFSRSEHSLLFTKM